MKIQREILESQVDDVAKDCYGPTFKFRPKQKEAVIDTIMSWFNDDKHNVIIQAPTGSGKSITAMTIAKVLSKYYKKRGYILASDLNLIEQYKNDVEKYFPEWAVIKGQQTYKCNENGLSFSSGLCKLKGCKSYGDIEKNFPDCSPTCSYLVDRKRAIRADVLVCTYSFWLIQQNIVKPMMGENAPFDSRDFVICDEAHKITDIVQKHFSPAFHKDDTNKMESILINGYGSADYMDQIRVTRYRIAQSEDNAELLALLKEYNQLMLYVADAIDTVSRDLSNRMSDGKKILTEDKQLAMYCDVMTNHINGFSEYADIIDTVGIQNLVKNWDGNNIDNITFNCIDESYLMGSRFHKHCDKRMYMSATIGNPDSFSKEMALKDYSSIDIPSTFDFSNSPIFFVPDFKLSYAEKNQNLPKVTELIECAARIYTGKRGIIQTGSYAFSKYLSNNIASDVSRRLIFYDDTKEKEEAIRYFKLCEDKILVGPSLIEGLSFDDDMCRFQIMMKVPYPSLADKFVSAKQRLRPEWYSDTTAISVLQGVGRGVRNEHDWCVTFVFDACFDILFNKARYMFNDEFVRRMQIIPASSILNYGKI